MQSRKIHGYPQQQYYGDDSSWMETKAQQLQSQGYPQTQQYPGMKPGYGKDSDYSMPNHNMYHQDSKPRDHGHGHNYDNNHGYGNGQAFPFGATTNHSPQHGKPFKHGGGGHNDYVSEHEYEVYKEERIGSGATKRDEVRYERRGTYGGDVHQASPYGYNNNPHGHGAKKGNWTLKGV